MLLQMSANALWDSEGNCVSMRNVVAGPILKALVLLMDYVMMQTSVLAIKVGRVVIARFLNVKTAVMGKDSVKLEGNASVHLDGKEKHAIPPHATVVVLDTVHVAHQTSALALLVGQVLSVLIPNACHRARMEVCASPRIIVLAQVGSVAPIAETCFAMGECYLRELARSTEYVQQQRSLAHQISVAVSQVGGVLTVGNLHAR